MARGLPAPGGSSGSGKTGPWDVPSRSSTAPAIATARTKPAWQGASAKRAGRSASWSSPGTALGKAAPADLREGFTINRVDEDEPYCRETRFGAIFADNTWPDEALVPGLHAAFETFYRVMGGWRAI